MPNLLRREPKILTEVVARCCEIKAEVVGKDETEGSLRAILNFGHTIGHALEAISGYSKYLHGEAISISQVAAAELSAADRRTAGGTGSHLHVASGRRPARQSEAPVPLGVKNCFAAMRLIKSKRWRNQVRPRATNRPGSVWGQAVPHHGSQPSIERLMRARLCVLLTSPAAYPLIK